jgi:hypothetical protein
MAEEVLLDVKTADAANLYKFFYLNQQKKDLRINRGDPVSHSLMVESSWYGNKMEKLGRC